MTKLNEAVNPVYDTAIQLNKYFNNDKILLTDIINNDIVNKKFDKLLVISYKGYKEVGRNKIKKKLYKVLCDCGIIKLVVRENLTCGTTRSCGCVRHQKLMDRHNEKRLPNGLSLWKYFFNHHNKSNAKVRDILTELSLEDFISICSQDCYYCGKAPTIKGCKNLHGTIPINGIDRIDNNIGYIKSNSRPCCEYCNRMKLDRTEEQFLNQVKAIYYNNLLTNKN